jgi:2-polyprenyl-3-methyl-5-hydroxy-6-metoxy-1,4-benzoquinol methylase
MTKEEKLNQINKEILQKNLGKARDRLHGLIAFYPNDLKLRTVLGAIYSKLQFPAMAGRYWYLEEKKTEVMEAACAEFEKSCGNETLQILLSIKFRGSIDKIDSKFAKEKLLALQNECKQRYSFYPEFGLKGNIKNTTLNKNGDKKLHSMAKHICPVWVGRLLASPIRKLLQNPDKILSPYVKAGMKVLDFGCAMGFFSLPMAKLVGPKGKIICIDIQEKMIKGLERRAHKAGIAERIQTRLCSQDSLCLEDFVEQIDFALAFGVVHEVNDASNLFFELHKTLKRSARLLVVEPKKRVTEKEFNESLEIAKQNKFEVVERPIIHGGLAVLLVKK